MAEQNKQELIEQIGQVTLDLSKYPGEDFYSDGQVEEELLKIVRDLSAVEYEKVIGERKNWPILYHLSPLRGNIVEWIPMDDKTKVLEVGSGCGAITTTLARKAGSVTCVELSKRRSTINAYRNSDCGNVTIHVGNFRDVEPTLPKDYDYICLIGVFEYAQCYIGGEHPFEDFLKILLPHLKESGRIVIAIENKYGMKYFAGCKEDHLGTYFGGVENYPLGGEVRTFGRTGLEKIFKRCGAEEYHFYYPYPDYKFMHTLYSDKRLPGQGELTDNLRNFDRDRMVLFDEKNAYDGLVEEELFPTFSNSYVAVIGKDFPLEYVKYSNDRSAEYAIKTAILRNEEGKRVVRKYPAKEQAKEHIRNMELAYQNLTKRYEGSSLEMNHCRLEDGKELYAEFEFVEGVSLSELMNQSLDLGNQEKFAEYFREYMRRIDYNNEMPVADFDLIFSNILVKDDKWTVIDYEWTFGKPIPIKESAFRAVYYLAREDENRGRLSLDWILEELGITQEDATAYWNQEIEFQKFVAGNRVTIPQMRDFIGCKLLKPLNWIDRFSKEMSVNRVQVYEDCGQGFSEENSYFVPDAYLEDDLVEVTLTVSGNVKMLRIDPVMDSCVVKILEMTFNGERVPLEKHKLLLPNGRILKPADKEAKVYQPSVVFPTTDPNLNIDLSMLNVGRENILYAKMKVSKLSVEVAQDMFANVKRLI